jgi:tripartite-type tricarboxylate transporter receptor subunit TctC
MPAASALPQVRAGKLRVLAVSSARRASGTPDVPAVAETLPGFDASFWFALYVTGGSPSAAVDRLSREVNEILQQGPMRERHKGDGVDVVGSTPAELAARMQADGPRWTAIQRSAGVQPE